MNLEGAQLIAASRADVWRGLNDPQVLKRCVPGCETMTQTAPDAFEAVVVQKIGPVKARFTGAVKLTDVVEAESYTITGEGKGGPAGMAKGGAQVRLVDEDGGTRLTYVVEASVSGKIAQLGGRLINAFAKKMADQFFDKFRQTMESGGDGDEVEAQEQAQPAAAAAASASADQPADAAASAAAETASADPAPKKKGFFGRLFG